MSREAAVISVKNVSGFVSVDKDGNWECMGGDKHKTERLPDPVSCKSFLVIISLLLNSTSFDVWMMP